MTAQRIAYRGLATQGPTEGTVPELPEGWEWADAGLAAYDHYADCVAYFADGDFGEGPRLYCNCLGYEAPVSVVLAVLARAGLLKETK